MVTRRSDILKEMGIAPLWRQRYAVPSSGPAEAESSETQAAKDQSADATSECKPIAEMGWEELEAAVSSCSRCGLCRTRTKTVFGVGDRQAEWLFIGEGPGYYEDKQGEPFVGKSGALLDNMLAALGLKRGGNAYIANVVKCRATDEQGKDRPPTAEEIAACLPYLQRQIELIQPRVMVALGKTAAVSLLGMDPATPVGQLRGKFHEYHRIPMVVTYHPAYLLRQPTEKRKAWSDLCLASDGHAQREA